MSDDEKKGIMLAYASELNFADLQNNGSIKKFLDTLTSNDKDPNTPGFKVCDFGVNDNLKAGQIQVIGGEDVRDAMSESCTFVGDGGPARYIFAL